MFPGYKYEYGKSTYIDKPQDAEIYFADLKKFFTGDVSELKEMWQLQPDAVFTAMVGIRTTERGSFMSIYTGNMLRPGNAAGSYTEKKSTRIMKAINDDKDRGSLADTEFVDEFIHEYKVDPTKLDEVITTNMPESDGLPF